MRKKIRFFKQHTLETCGAACMLMLLDYYGKVEYPTAKMEMKLYSLYRSRAFKGMNGGEAARCLARNGLSVHLMHSSAAMMENRDGYFPEELYRALFSEYREAVEKCADSVRFTTCAVLNCETLKQELDAGRQVMVQCIVPGDADGMHDHVLHWVVVHGYDGDAFLVCDPLSSKIRISAEAMEVYMDSPIGRIWVCVGAPTENTP